MTCGPRTLVGVAVLAWLAGASCGKPPEPITVNGGAVVVRNLTKQDWQYVQIDVNTWYRNGAPKIPAGSFVNADLSTFIDGYGRHFDPSHTSVATVVVKTTDSAGQPVRLTWEGGAR